MAVELLDKEKLLFDEAKEFALKKIAPYADQWENGEKTSREAMNVFAESGYCSIGISKELGGRGYNFLECALIYEGLAHGDGALSSSILQLHNNIICLLAKYYDKNEVIRDLFPAIVSGHKRLAFAITEKHSGSDPSSMNSYAELRHDGYHVYGKKAWIFNALEADYFVITVKNGSPDTKQMLMFLVDRNTPGFTIGDNTPRLGNNCISCCNVYFDGCIISKNRLITEKGFSAALSFIDLPRIFVPSIAIGMSQRIIDITIKYLGDRKSFSKFNISNKGVQWTLFKLVAQVDAGRWLVYRTASKMDKFESINIQSAMNKLFATQVAMDTITKCLQIFGEKGYDKLSVLSRYMAVAKLLQIVDGTSEIQKIVIGRDLERQANE
ncbi:MAG: acyl-CoA/acyl-ACP dehydrogenase [Desulfobacula sp.]|jgi:butyryl-CoA dehydrogenase|nr:acyl-CoA/acyl-ACP dehydrogenase [Desulfobacula sp.]